MIIPVTPIKQDTPYACATTCLRMLLDHCGVDVSGREIEDFLTQTSSDGTAYLTELARFAVMQGLSATCFGFNLAFFDPPRDTSLSRHELIRRLAEQRPALRDQEFIQQLDAISEALQEGVDYKIVRPSESLLEMVVRRNLPLLLSVPHTGLYQRQGDVYAGHTVVVNGWEDGQFWFIDPSDGQQRAIDPDDLLFAIYSRKLIADDAYMVEIHRSQSLANK